MSGYGLRRLEAGLRSIGRRHEATSLQPGVERTGEVR